MALFMGIDIGTQSVRCGVVDGNGYFLAVHEESYRTLYPRPGYAEQVPGDWIKSLESAVLRCRKDLGGEQFAFITGISVCATSSTVVPVKDGQPLSNALLWMDNRASEEAKRINSAGHEILRHCGGEASVEWLVPKMMWIRNNEGDVFRGADRIVEAQDFINHYLTGIWTASVSQAVCKAHYVEARGGFNAEFFDAIGFPEFFDKANTTVLKQGEALGPVRQELVKRLGFPENAVVYQGGIDAHVNMIGLGVCKSGEAGVVMGTSFVQLALTERPAFGKGIWGPYKDAVVPGAYCLEGGQVSAGSIIKWFFRECSVTGENPYERLGNEASAIPRGSDGLLTLDFFQGNRTPYKDPAARGAFYGLTLAHTKLHLYRSILEGIAFGMRNVLDSMEAGAASIKQWRGCGGGTQNKLWLRIIADVTGRPIALTRDSGNAGILGAAICAATGSGACKHFEAACAAMTKVTGLVEPDMAGHEAYEVYYRNYLRLYQSTKALNG